MSQSDLQVLVGKVMSDDDFVQQLITDPRSALKSAGIEPTAEMLDALTGVDLDSIRSLASAFDGDQAAAA